MTRLNRLHFGLAPATLAVLGFTLRLNAVVAADSGQGRHLGQEKKSRSDEPEQDDQSNESLGRRRGHHAYRFEARERDIITGYYANPSQGLPPGLAKRGGNLPPGLEKQLMRNGTLPPGLQKRLNLCLLNSSADCRLYPLAVAVIEASSAEMWCWFVLGTISFWICCAPAAGSRALDGRRVNITPLKGRGQH